MVTDSLGNWTSIGQLLVAPDWQLFSSEIIHGSTFRFTYAVNWDSWKNSVDGKTYIVARFYYPNGNDIIVSPCFKLFPKQQKEIRQLLLPKELEAKGIVTRSLGIKAIRIGKYSKMIKAPIVPWSLQVEYLIS